VKEGGKVFIPNPTKARAVAARQSKLLKPGSYKLRLGWDVNVRNLSASNSLHLSSRRRNTDGNLRITITHRVFFWKLWAVSTLRLRLWQHHYYYLRCHSNSWCKKCNYSRLGNRTYNRWSYWRWTWRTASCPRRNTWTHCSPKQKSISTLD